MTIDFGPSLSGRKAMIADVVRENSLFLSAAAVNNHHQLRSIAAWFGHWHQSSSGILGHLGLIPRYPLDEQTLNLLRFADIGVIGSALVERSPEEVDAGLGPSATIPYPADSRKQTRRE